MVGWTRYPPGLKEKSRPSQVTFSRCLQAEKKSGGPLALPAAPAQGQTAPPDLPPHHHWQRGACSMCLVFRFSVLTPAILTTPSHRFFFQMKKLRLREARSLGPRHTASGRCSQ